MSFVINPPSGGGGGGPGSDTTAWHNTGDAYPAGVLANTAAPDASAQLQMNSTTQGWLPPRMTTAQKLLIAAPATGLYVFDTNLARYEFWNGAAWAPIGGPDPTAWHDGGDAGYVGTIGTTDATDFSLQANGLTRLRCSQLRNQVIAADGIPGFPGYGFASGINNGMFYVAVNQVGFTAAGVQVAQFTNFGSFVVGTGGVGVTPASSSQIVAESAAGQSFVISRAYSAVPQMIVNAYGGAKGAPTPVTNGQALGRFGFNGGYSGALNATASYFESYATENWGLLATGSDFRVFTNPNGTFNNGVERLRLQQDGKAIFYANAVDVGQASDAVLSQVAIYDGGGADLAGELVLYDEAGSAHTLWVDSTGDLRIENAATKTNDTAGVVVGTQV